MRIVDEIRVASDKEVQEATQSEHVQEETGSPVELVLTVALFIVIGAIALHLL